MCIWAGDGGCHVEDTNAIEQREALAVRRRRQIMQRHRSDDVECLVAEIRVTSDRATNTMSTGQIVATDGS